MNYEYKDPDIKLINQLKENISLSDDEFVEAIISAALYAEDRKWIRNTIIEIINGEHNTKITSAALKALGHIARIDRNISIYDLDKIPNIVLNNTGYSSLIDDLRDDILIFNK